MIKISGEIIHSRSFKSATGYENKTAVVVGLGNSGCDAATELRFECFSKNDFF
jgi:cation diffusion facilitator CzcD-associated flavoprotein CzcO